jgi:phosphatidylserine/phosphatidylglycerophosphate/cardiolipin synthase-like enzyme
MLDSSSEAWLSQNPKYIGTWQGKVIQSLVLHGNEPVSFNKLLEETGFGAKALLRALAPLRQANVISYEGKNYSLIDQKLRDEWSAYLKTSHHLESTAIKPQATSEIKPEIQKETSLIQLISQWREMRNLTFPMETKHFFLEGEYLDELARVLIGKAQKQILVTNPFIDSCHLTKNLENAVLRKISVKAVARRPKDSHEEVTKRECQASLRKAGMIIHYDNQIHAKIIVIDGEVAIVSSMNLYSASSGGFTKEAGIVSVDQQVVSSVSKYIQEILNKPESTDSRY